LASTCRLDVGDVASSPAKDPCPQSPRLVTPEGDLVGDIVPKLHRIRIESASEMFFLVIRLVTPEGHLVGDIVPKWLRR